MGMMEIPEKILIVGLGSTGISVAKFLEKLGKAITITDMKEENELSGAITELKDIHYKACFGRHNLEDFLNNQMIVLSPGVDIEMPYVKAAREKGIK